MRQSAAVGGTRSEATDMFVGAPTNLKQNMALHQQQVVSPYLRPQDMISPVNPRGTNKPASSSQTNRANAYKQHQAGNRNGAQTRTSTLNNSSIISRPSGAPSKQRNRTQLISPSNFQNTTSQSNDLQSQYMVISQGQTMVPLGMGSFVPNAPVGYTTTNAKDHGKRAFNFSIGGNVHTQSSAMQNQLQQYNSSQHNSLDNSAFMNPSSKQSSAKGNLGQQSVGGQSQTQQRVGRYNDLRSSFRVSQNQQHSQNMK